MLKRSESSNAWRRSGSKERRGGAPEAERMETERVEANGWKRSVSKWNGWKSSVLKPSVLKRSGWRLNDWRRSALKPSELRLNGPRPNWMTDRVSHGEVDDSVVREALAGICRRAGLGRGS